MDLPTDQAIPTRYSLLNRLQDWQDNVSWQDFFNTYWRLIYSVALRAGLTETEAQEVVQETLICVAKNIHRFKRDKSLGSFKGWLRNITRWRIADQLRKRTRRPSDGIAAPSDQNEMPATVEADCEAAWEVEWKAHLLQRAIERIKHRAREEHFQIFDLYALRQWPVKKITQTLGVSAPRVYLAKHRVAAMIKKEIIALEKEER
jgi:RNA polymerase sigma-70 factor (ECF subfamily)